MVFNKFAEYVLDNPKAEVIDLYNEFILKQNDEMQKFLTENCMLMLKVGKSARNAIPSVQNIIRKGRK